ncbi:MAG: hypothetical protein ACPL3C_08665 [Pyrobaculum sp.]|uniref:hypothetical protein n=1 Tax=Pyrobaculum sp. TaxID=2004705 RepID=UPI003CAD2D1F
MRHRKLRGPERHSEEWYTFYITGLYPGISKNLYYYTFYLEFSERRRKEKERGILGLDQIGHVIRYASEARRGKAETRLDSPLVYDSWPFFLLVQERKKKNKSPYELATSPLAYIVL